MIKSNPTSPGVRWKVKLNKVVYQAPICKNLLSIKKGKSGRNNSGRITVKHKGGGVKKYYRIVDFKRNKYYIRSYIDRLEYDPNRNCNLFLLLFSDGERRYILGLKGIKVGDVIYSGAKLKPTIGNSMFIRNIPLGLRVCCVELIPSKGAKFARSAGSYCTLISHGANYSIIKMRSGRLRKLNGNCMATIGEIGNQDFYLRKLGKAGINRLKGIRPTVRGVAMNPVDHPHGGGEGKTSSKRDPVDSYGNLSKGFKTRKNKRTKNMVSKNFLKKK